MALKSSCLSKNCVADFNVLVVEIVITSGQSYKFLQGAWAFYWKHFPIHFCAGLVLWKSFFIPRAIRIRMAGAGSNQKL